MSGEQRFPRSVRIRSGSEIRRLHRRGRRHRRGALDLFIASAGAARPRVGVVVPRFGRRGVERNLVRRRIREILRRDWLPRADSDAAPIDVLVRACPGAYDLSFRDLRATLLSGLREGVC
ncbi:MAG: ribonuclease P protein component [Gemmatimonadota bacterium]